MILMRPFCCTDRLSSSPLHPIPLDPNPLITLLLHCVPDLSKRSQQGDLDEAILLHRQALKLFPPPHPNRSGSLNNLASVLLTRFEHGGQQHDLDEAISLHRQALKLRPPPHPDRSTSLDNLASGLFTQFEQGGHQDDLNEAILLQRQALKLFPPPHPSRSRSLTNLASMLLTQFLQGGQQGNLDEAISLHRQALKLRPSSHPFRSKSLNSLANALWTKFKQGGQRGDLDEAISLFRQALELRPPPHSDRSDSLDDLASALLTRFEQGRQQGDLDEAILLHRQALKLFPPPHPNRPASLNNLANALLTRFEQADGQQGDLNEAIFLQKEPLGLFPPSHPMRYASLANELSTQFVQGGQQGDLNEAILLQKEALELFPPSHSEKYASLSNLADGLLTQFEQGGQLGDLDKVISLHRQALKRFHPSHPMRSECLNNFANALSHRFGQKGQRGDLDEAISLHRQALKLRPSPHPLRSRSLYNLAILLMRAYSVTNNDPIHLTNAMTSFSAAIQCLSKSPSEHFHIAETWAYHADLHQHPSAIEAYDAALFILPQLVALGLDIHSRHKALAAGSDGLARRAARCAIQERRLDKAVEYLDTGRGVFWSQLLCLRSPVDQLHDLAPELADRLHNIATALEHGSHRDTFSETLDNQKKMTLEEEATRLARLDKEWSKAVDEARALDGFKDFLKTSRLSSLQAAAAKSPVVLLISNDDGSHCLIVTSTSVHCIALSALSVAKLRNLVYLIQAGASQSKISRSSESIEKFSHNTGTFPPAIQETLRNWVSLEEERGVRRYPGQIPSDNIFRSVLKTIWDEVVKPVIDFLSLQVSLRSVDNDQIYLQNILEIRGSSCAAVVPNWPVFFPSYPCSWLL
jgi:tetratricopeptide (TPR) repeat protein